MSPAPAPAALASVLVAGPPSVTRGWGGPRANGHLQNSAPTRMAGVAFGAAAFPRSPRVMNLCVPRSMALGAGDDRAWPWRDEGPVR